MMTPTKAEPDDFFGRFREIVSDPINFLIERVPMAGVLIDEDIVLHNGLRVPFEGEGSYFGEFSKILQINRGVHEPLEEFVFQELLKILPDKPTCLELGAYWAHYSMWLKHVKPHANAILLEPLSDRLQVGVSNFRKNGFEGEFIQAWVGNNEGEFQVDSFLENRPEIQLDILHADIDLYEVEMLKGARKSLANHMIGYLLISTHSQELHVRASSEIMAAGYRVEVSSDFDNETTSYDGFLFASSPKRRKIFESEVLTVLGRNDIACNNSTDLLKSLDFFK